MMIKLTQGNILLNARAQDKTEAIRIAGNLLVDAGNMQPGYIDSMLLREKVANTYLGNGIAIPHGLPRDRDLILRTGISVSQFPDGVQWHQGETVYLVVAIAARSDEHIELLANLTDVLDDPQTVHRLATTSDPLDIIARLTQPRDGGSVSTVAPAEAADDFAKWVDVALTGPAGLHARPAAAFVDIARQFESEVRVRHIGKVANGKSLLSLLKLGAGTRAGIRIMARGSDADAALEALAAAVRHGLEDAAEASPSSDLVAPSLSAAGARDRRHRRLAGRGDRAAAAFSTREDRRRGRPPTTRRTRRRACVRRSPRPGCNCANCTTRSRRAAAPRGPPSSAPIRSSSTTPIWSRRRNG
jgi:phosphotransferase system HPr (HPr) family protein